MPEANDDAGRAEAVDAVIGALDRHGFVVNSECWNLPAAVDAGHPLHEAVAVLERTYPGNRLPARGRALWRRLLRETRARNHTLYDAADEFTAWLERTTKVPTPGGGSVSQQLDGVLEGPGHPVKWRDKILDVRPQSWRLLKVLWDVDKATVERVEEAVWEGDETTYGNLKSAVHRANVDLAGLKVPWRLGIKGGYVCKREPK
ncbi:hypothetical protein [Paludisphaera sp.]|uniref:hypothetical protein n=1 Tax=Paludisphaera sp. TaxID=2017432 RepID=UPI00301C775B